MMKIEIRHHTFNPYEEMQIYADRLMPVGMAGATANFIGSMRGTNQGKKVITMTLEHYPRMTEKQLHMICDDAFARWKLIDILLLHRVGDIGIGEVIVLVAVWSSHRKDAFEACRYIMEDLKSKAPFWKKERLIEGERWVQSNTAGF